MRLNLKPCLALACSFVCAASMAKSTPQDDSLLDLTPEELTRVEKIMFRDSYIPTDRGNAASSITSPSAAGGAGTIVSAGVMYVDHWSNTKQEDGNMYLAVSAGDPRESLGLLFSATIDSIGINHAFAKNGGFGFRVNRYVLPSTAVALGVSNLGGWNAWQSNPKTYYAAVTHDMELGELPVSLNAGMGTGALYKLSATNDDDLRGFASVGLELFKNFSLIADYTTKQFSAGGNYTIPYFKNFPAYIGAARININEYDNSRSFFQVTAGISYIF